MFFLTSPYKDQTGTLVLEAIRKINEAERVQDAEGENGKNGKGEEKKA